MESFNYVQYECQNVSILDFIGAMCPYVLPCLLLYFFYLDFYLPYYGE